MFSRRRTLFSIGEHVLLGSPEGPQVRCQVKSVAAARYGRRPDYFLLCESEPWERLAAEHQLSLNPSKLRT